MEDFYRTIFSLSRIDSAYFIVDPIHCKMDISMFYSQKCQQNPKIKSKIAPILLVCRYFHFRLLYGLCVIEALLKTRWHKNKHSAFSLNRHAREQDRVA